jgi:hypothetical protein
MATQDAIIDEMLEPFADALTPETARLFVDLKAPPSIRARVNELAAKSNEGQLSDAERSDYENYVRVGSFFSLIKAKAKRVIARGASQ